MRTDVINVNSIHLINAINSDLIETEMLIDFEHSIKMKENFHPSHFESHKIPIHILTQEIAKLWQILQGILYVSLEEA